MQRALLFLAIFMSFVLAAPAARAVPLKTVRVASFLSLPLYATSPPWDFDRLFILEQGGRIKILKNGVVLARPFLDLSSVVSTSANEEGLLGLAFPANYSVSGAFFCCFTVGPTPGSIVIRRFHTSSDPDSAIAGPGEPLLTLPLVANDHHGGHIAFAADGMLFFGMGDGDSDGTGEAAQDGQSLFGKMLRLDIDGDAFPGDPDRNYAIPADNPFVGDPNVRDEIWALGLRNPYRWSFDRETGDLVIGDVGEFSWEEIDFEPAATGGGRNYGWPFMEGAHCYTPPFNCNDGALTLPVHEFPHDPPGFCWAITGGAVYRGAAMPALRGTYFFADFCRSLLWTCRVSASGVTEIVDRTAELDPPFVTIQAVAGFGEDAAGEMYIVDRKSTFGDVFKIVPDSAAVAAPFASPFASASPLVELDPPHPNPTRGVTRLTIRLARDADVRADVVDAGGRLVRRFDGERRFAGASILVWDGRDDAGRAAAAGVYFFRVKAGDESASRNFVLER